ncbi:unnamed protein product [Didymodactylos carnosus]|uniref:PhoD-like phosphatase domain-containing protein n=2 Tax=Didymodactylos carnosus TaxID=1234261 RepID=A0A815GYX2_9BILA|nr:unnamed protein product [Didymodactylos carnosus]CAF4209491.1 unnamed protein product [Didymodactylos carnosus]
MKDSHGDYDPNTQNPVNPDPDYNGDYPEQSASIATISPADKIKEMPASSKAATASPAVNRPPKPPGYALGPYLQFLTTDLDHMLWYGSALIFRHVSFNDKRPKIEFICEPKVDYTWEILYDNIFDMRAYRVHIKIELRDGASDDKIAWKIDWTDHTSEGLFHIAQRDQRWRGGFFSCNGFDATVPEQVVNDLTYTNVWKHLNSVHEENPLHLLVWGGDQNYIDFIFEDCPYLKDWVDMEWNKKWTCDFREDLREQVERYHFNMYTENWERPEVKYALETVPSLMTWDDHDIFDGAGSYPPLLHDSPVMMGLFRSAQKMRLLFQHHTTVEKACTEDHTMFGYKSYNFLARCGPHLAILGTDSRSERDAETIMDQRTWDMIFDKLNKIDPLVQHLIVIFAVPFSFLRFRLAESIFERFKNATNKCRTLPIVKQTNSIFGLPELYDDLLDEWTHQAHIRERDRGLQRFQQLSNEKRLRITFFSGDVHTCGIARFQTRRRRGVIQPVNDSKLMYQVISSAIVNIPPSRKSLHVAHYFKTKWYPDGVEDTEEELTDFFERMPETGRKLVHKKLLPNRNWCYFEQSSSATPTVVQKVGGFFHRHFSSSKNNVLPITLGPTSTADGQGSAEPPVHTHTEGRFCRQQTEQSREGSTNELTIRLWLESSEKHKEGRQFVSYELLIPGLL